MLPNPTIEESNHKSETNSLRFDPSITDLEDFCSSFLDFDSIKDWEEQGLPMDDVAVSNLNMEKDDTFEKMGHLGNLIDENIERVSLEKLENGKKLGADVAVSEKDYSFDKMGDLGTLIDENIERVKLVELDNSESLGADVAYPNSNLEKGVTFDKFGNLGTLNDENMGKVKLAELDNASESLGADMAYPDSNLEKGENFEKFKNLGTLNEEFEGFKSKVEKSDAIEKFGGLGILIDANKGKVSMKCDDSSSSDSDSESESESSDSSSSSEEDAERVKGKIEMEDGEINDSDVEKMVGWSDDEFGDEDGGISKGPVKSRNEIKDLPHVPPVEASLQPRHQTVPVGVISSIIDAQVIVEGVEQHNPLNEGTIFWITESRSPLGIVDEIFGPVKSPFYMIRYNSENEVPEGIKQGTPVSFVPEFANHVLKDNLYKKGYDASGENDEEVSDDYEFSDDEQEAEYRKLQKMKKKRGTNEANYTNEFNERKSFKNRGGGSSKQNQFSRGQNNVASKTSGGSFQNNTSQSGVTQVATSQSQNHGNVSNFIPPTQLQAPGFIPPPNVVWMNGMLGQQGMMNGMQGQQGMINGMPGQQGMMNGMPGQQGMMNGMPGQQGMMNGMPGQQGTMNGMMVQQGMVFPGGMIWPQQNMLLNGIPFPQQFAQNQNFAPNGILPGTQPNFSGTPTFGPRPGPFVQNGLIQQFVGAIAPMNINGQCAPSQGNTEMPREFNQGANQGGGRGRHHRGGGRFTGGRGRHQAK